MMVITARGEGRGAGTSFCFFQKQVHIPYVVWANNTDVHTLQQTREIAISGVETVTLFKNKTA